jgi:hypothetical protein
MQRDNVSMNDEPVTVPSDQRGELADVGGVGEVDRAGQDLELPVTDGGVPALFPCVDSRLEPECALGCDVEHPVLLGGASLPWAAGCDGCGPVERDDDL